MNYEYDLVVIGGGSGGVACANEAAKFGANCALIESSKMGGTCVNVGCVPKKLMWLAGHTADIVNHASDWGFRPHQAELNWQQLVKQRQAYIARLNKLYANKLAENNVKLYREHGKLLDQHTIQVGEQTITAKHVVIATGGKPYIPDLPGREFGIDSDGFFELQQQPKNVVIIGAGYIAVELAGLLRSLGSEVHLLFRYQQFLRQFDNEIACELMKIYENLGIHLCPRHLPIGVEEVSPGVYCVNCQDKDRIGNIDTVIWATGRQPNTDNLFTDTLHEQLVNHGFITVNDEQQTACDNIYAVGDVTGQMALTPVAIAQGRRLARKLFDRQTFNKIDYNNIATVVFSHPPMANCGITEDAAKQQGLSVTVFKSSFKPMTQAFAGDAIPCMVKLIVCKHTDKVLGCHILGDGADEIMQGFSVAIRCGATKKDFDDTIAIHPTFAEELVTLR